MIEGIRESLPDMAVSDCPKCNLQIQQGAGLDAVHPIELLAIGYRVTYIQKIKKEGWSDTSTNPQIRDSIHYLHVHAADFLLHPEQTPFLMSRPQTLQGEQPHD